MPKPWGFYGRQDEIRFLHEFMDELDGFEALVIRGRRQVGKTDLIHHFFANEFRAERDRPVFICHLFPAGQDTSQFHGILKRAVRETRPDLLEGFLPDDDPVISFPFLVRHLLDRGGTVVLDEFQRIAPGGNDGLPGLFQGLIDEQQRRRGAAPGRLIVMGSEQQKLMDMFQDPRAPMFNRIWRQLHLRPWRFGELAEAATDRGWDTRPERLLTLWTAYGGMPVHWKRFARTPQLADFGRPLSDIEWTDAFLAAEETCRHTPHGDFARQMEVLLRPGDREVLAWLAEEPGGRRLETLPTRLQPVLAAEFHRRTPGRENMPERQAAREMLFEAVTRRLSGAHLGLLDRRNAVDDPEGVQRWHVADNHARFQLDVLEQASRKAREIRPTMSGEVRELYRERLRRAEGRGLETLALAGLEKLFTDGDPPVPPGRTDNSLLHGAWRKAPETAEIDILAVGSGRTPGAAERLWAGFAKRAVDRHDPAGDCSALAKWLAPAPHSATAEQRLAVLRAWERCMVFVSLLFTERDREGLAEKVARARGTQPAAREIGSWFTMDLADMLSGRGPRALAPPEPEEAPDGDSEGSAP